MNGYRDTRRAPLRGDQIVNLSALYEGRDEITYFKPLLMSESPCVLVKVSRRISSLVVTSPRREANLMVVCVAGSARLHPCSCAASCFLRERINRVIITGTYLRRDSDLMVSKENRSSDLHNISTIARRKTRWINEGITSRCHSPGRN